jgi:hypothetical protein
MRVRRRLFHLLVGCLVASAAAGLDIPAVTATTTTTGSGSLQGTATFGSGFPCSGCSGGVLSAAAAMSLSGAPQAGIVYTASWPDPRTSPLGSIPINLTANFAYSGTCEASDSLPAVLGNAGGSFTVSGGQLELNGTLWDNATLTGTFNWQQLGPTTAAVTMYGLSITGGAGPSQIALNLDNSVIGVGVVSLAWMSGPGTCQNQQQPSAAALITGSVVQPT